MASSEGLSRVEEAFGVEDLFQGPHKGEGRGRDLGRKPGPFGESHPVFPGEGPGKLKDQAEEVFAQGPGAGFLLRLKEDVYVEVPVSGVSETGEGEGVFPGAGPGRGAGPRTRSLRTLSQRR